MSKQSSVLLLNQIPSDLADILRSEDIDPNVMWLRSATDLNLTGEYEEVYLLVDNDRLITAALPNADNVHAVRMDIPRSAIKEIRTRQGIGGGFLEAQIDGIYVEILAYSNSRADLFHKVVKKLKDWLQDKEVTIGPEDDYDPRKCPECGMTLQFKGDICPRCVNRGAIFVRVLKLMRPYTGRAIIMMAFVFLGIGIALVPPQLTRLLIDEVINIDPPLERSAANWWLLGLVLALLGTHIVSTLVGIFAGRLSSFVGTQISFDMRERVFNHLATLGVDYYDRYNVGQLMSRVVGDTGQMRGFIQQLTSGFVAQILMVIIVGIVLFILSWKLAIFTLLPAPIVMIAATYFWKRIYPRHYKIWDSNSKLHGTLNTILSGVRVVKAFGQEKREQNRFNKSSGYVKDSARGVEYTVSIFNPSIGLVFQLGGLIVWFVGGREVIGDEMTLGALMAFFGYLGMFYMPLRNLTQLTNWFTQFLTATQRTFEILDTPSQIIPVKNPEEFSNPLGGIVFDNVTFGYERHEPILKNISFEIKPGEHIGIVGKSGSGKTTMVNLLARFYDVDEGRVMVDGLDVRDLDIKDLRKCVGVVLQEPFLFRGTLYSNLTYGKYDATPEEVIAAAKAANSHQFIMRHPLGYDTYIGERGSGLSGGERQRASIARALLYDPKILVLDEATSSVDTESEKLIQEALVRVTEGRTTIAIAHRLSTLKNSDRIFVMEDGSIVERGTHEELMELGGLYYRLVNIQTELTSDKALVLAKKKNE